MERHKRKNHSKDSCCCTVKTDDIDMKNRIAFERPNFDSTIWPNQDDQELVVRVFVILSQLESSFSRRTRVVSADSDIIQADNDFLRISFNTTSFFPIINNDLARDLNLSEVPFELIVSRFTEHILSKPGTFVTFARKRQCPSSAIFHRRYCSNNCNDAESLSKLHRISPCNSTIGDCR